MSDVKRWNFILDKFKNIVPYASERGQYVRHADYAKLEAEAQALREEVAALRKSEIVGSYTIKHMAIDITAVGEALGISSEDQEGGTGEFIEVIQELQEELAALRARVVVPDEYAEFEAWLEREKPAGCIGDMERGWMQRARLNGKAVSEGLLLGLMQVIEKYTHDARVPNEVSQELATELILAKRALLGEGKEHE